MALINLKTKEVAQLEKLVTIARDARQILRAQALLWLDEGESVEEVAERLQVSRQSIYNWVLRFEERRGAALSVRVADGVRNGRPPTAKEIIDPLLAAVIDADPRKLGYNSTVWTNELLQSYLASEHQILISTKSVSRALDRLEIIWKSPRHTLARRAEFWRQAKGASNVAFGRAHGLSS